MIHALPRHLIQKCIQYLENQDYRLISKNLSMIHKDPKYFEIYKILDTNRNIDEFDKNLNLKVHEIGTFTDDVIRYLSDRIIGINLFDNKKITNYGIEKLSRLQFLGLSFNKLITDDTLKLFKNLTWLDIGFNKNITDEGIKDLTCLVYLNMEHSSSITDDGIFNLVRLEKLNLSNCKYITDRGISQMYMIKWLCLNDTRGVTNIKHMKDLEYLNICHNNIIIDESEFKKLKKIRRS